MKQVVTIFEDLYNKAPLYITVETALQRIQSGKQKQKIERVRSGDKDAKKLLPIVLWSGVFNERKDESLQKHSGIIVLDFDHVDDVEDAKARLAFDPHVVACWTSPSGDGVKALVEISNPERHRDHFRSLCDYFQRKHELEADPSGINESRACFESYDDNICINSEPTRFGGLKSEQHAEPDPTEVKGRTDYEKLQIAAQMIRYAPDGGKHAALVRASYLMGGFIAAGRVEEDEAFRVLVREIEARNPLDLDQARKTIVDGIEQGKLAPIGEITRELEKVRHEMRVNDGDMSFITSDDRDYEWIQKFIAGQIELGLGTENEKFDEYFRFKREFLMINGHSNVGKTTFTLWLMVAASMLHGWKWLVYSAENPTWANKIKVMQFCMDMPIKRMNHKELTAAHEWVNKHFTFVDNHKNYSVHDILVFAEKMKNYEGIDGILVDPYNALRIDLSSHRGLSTHEYHYEAASEFLTFSNKHQVAVWVNAHAFTEAQRRKGPDGLPLAPYAEDTEGGGKFVNRADGFITLHRKTQAEDWSDRRTVEMHVRKVRMTETGGNPTALDYPLRFEFSKQQSGFNFVSPGPRLFRPLCELLVGKQMKL
jgi:hypothetical protein